MWRSLLSTGALRGATWAALVSGKTTPSLQSRSPLFLCGLTRAFSDTFAYRRAASTEATATATPPESEDSRKAKPLDEGGSITLVEAKKLLRLVNVEALKTKLSMEGKEVVGYPALLEASQSIGIARSLDEAVAFARVLDEAGVFFIFRDKVYLHPDKVVDLVRRAMPLVLTSEDEPTREELKKLQEKKEEIDVLAHKQVRRVLWTGLVCSVGVVGLFIRLTFWELSWDVMEPIAFFTTATGLVVGYAYFMFTARDPTYQDFMRRLFLSRQRKLIKRCSFDVGRYKELQKKCRTSMDTAYPIKNRVGLELELEDAVHRD